MADIENKKLGEWNGSMHLATQLARKVADEMEKRGMDLTDIYEIADLTEDLGHEMVDEME